MLQIFTSYKPLTRIYDDFMIYDEQEQARLQRQQAKAKFAYRQQKYLKQANREPAKAKPSLFSGQIRGFDHHYRDQNNFQSDRREQAMPALPDAANVGYKLDRKAKQVLSQPSGYDGAYHGARYGKMDDK